MDVHACTLAFSVQIPISLISAAHIESAHTVDETRLATRTTWPFPFTMVPNKRDDVNFRIDLRAHHIVDRRLSQWFDSLLCAASVHASNGSKIGCASLIPAYLSRKASAS